MVRRGNKLYPRDRTGRDAEPEGTAAETQEDARRYWEEELERAKRFIEERKQIAVTGRRVSSSDL